MAYATGTSSTIADLVSAIISFATANAGFSSGSTWTNTSRNLVSINKAGVHFVFSYNATTLFLNTSTAISTATGTIGQTGAAPLDCECAPLTPPHTGYHLFTDGARVHCAIEIVPSVFSFLSFGSMRKLGSWTGGEYVCANHTVNIANSASYPSPYHDYLFNGYSNQSVGTRTGHVRSTYDGYTIAAIRTTFLTTGMHLAAGSNLSATEVSMASAEDTVTKMIVDSPNAFNSRAVIVPFWFRQATTRAVNPTTWIPMGDIPNAGLINIQNLDPKQVVNTDWMVFPISQKNGPNTTYYNSFNYGYAFRQ